METVTKRDLAHLIAECTGITKLAAVHMVDSVFTAMREQLIAGSRIEVRRFGVLETRNTEPKPAARNPRTGEIVYVPARRKTHFRVGRALKEGMCQPLQDRS